MMLANVAPEAYRPPYSNRGVYPSMKEGLPYAVPGVDAYCATVFANADSVYDDLTCLLESAGLSPSQVTGPKVPYYARNLLLLAPDGHRLLQVRAGGSNPHPFVDCTGGASPLVCGFLRASYGHNPTRIDAARDMGGPGLFKKLHRLGRRIVRKYNIKYNPIGNTMDPDAGLTIELGSRSSQVFLRIYEKGKKYARDMGIPLTDELRQWVRVEAEFKPQNPKSKAVARSIDPDAIWGTSPWLAEFAREAFQMHTQPININQRRESDRDRALRFMGNQYGAHLAALFVECGRDPAAFGAAILDLAGVEHNTH